MSGNIRILKLSKYEKISGYNKRQQKTNISTFQISEYEKISRNNKYQDITRISKKKQIWIYYKIRMWKTSRQKIFGYNKCTDIEISN